MMYVYIQKYIANFVGQMLSPCMYKLIYKRVSQLMYSPVVADKTGEVVHSLEYYFS